MMRGAAILALAVAGAHAAHAQSVQIKPIADVRVRYEHAEQTGVAEAADAVTLRARAGITASSGKWSALIEGEAVVVPVDRFNDGLNGRTQFPLVPDAPNLELNRAQLRYADGGALSVTGGRQRIALADERFVGPAAWRQSEQTFDAARVQLGKAQGPSLDLTYSWNVQTVTGERGRGARPAAIGGNNLFALIGYGLPFGRATAFTYVVDQDAAAVQGFRLSSRTIGLRFAGTATIAPGVKLGYAASWAEQRDHRRNPNRYSAQYRLGELSLSKSGFTLLAGHEVLGADGGVALTSFQTPLASAFKFNGWAGKFVTTPPDGLRDSYVTVSHAGKAGALGMLTLGATWHHFESDRLVRRYGDELDLLASAKRGPFTLSARYAHYAAKRFATDTDKVWLQLDWALD